MWQTQKNCTGGPLAIGIFEKLYNHLSKNQVFNAMLILAAHHFPIENKT